MNGKLTCTELELERVRLEAKIKKALLEDPPMDGMFGFAQFLNRTLSLEDVDVLEKMDKEFGEEDCNGWLSGVLTSSGEYKSNGVEGVVEWDKTPCCGRGNDCTCRD